MLSLRSVTPADWVARIEPHLDEVLVDHAHCEKKAAGAALNMVFAYVEYPEFIVPLTEIVEEELQHFRQVLEILDARGVKLIGQPQSSYGRRLFDLMRTDATGKAVDRCCISALIEARSCERFTLLRDHLSDRDLAAFYGSLLESEARHHGINVRLAETFASRDVVRARLDELAEAEAAIISVGDALPRLHS